MRKRISWRKAFSIFPNRNIIHTRTTKPYWRRRLYTQCPPIYGVYLFLTQVGVPPPPDPKLTKGGAQKKPPRKENRTNQFFPRPRSHLPPSQIPRSHDFVRFPPLKKGFIFPSTQKWEGFLGNAPISRLSLSAVYTVRGNSATIKMEPVCETKAWGEILGRKPFQGAGRSPPTCGQNTRGEKNQKAFLCFFSFFFSFFNGWGRREIAFFFHLFPPPVSFHHICRDAHARYDCGKGESFIKLH